MSRSMLVFPVLKSSSAERLRDSNKNLHDSRSNLGKTAVQPINLRIGLDVEINPLAKKTVPWVRGVEYVQQRNRTVVQTVGSIIIAALTANESGNRGLWIAVDPQVINSEIVPGAERRSQYFRDEAIAETVMRFIGVSRNEVVHPTHTTLWHVEGETVILGHEYDVTSDFKVGGGGGLLYLYDHDGLAD